MSFAPCNIVATLLVRRDYHPTEYRALLSLCTLRLVTLWRSASPRHPGRGVDSALVERTLA